MRKGIFLAVLAMAAVGALALAGAGSAAKPATGASAVPRAASIHVGASLVRQVGARNYAGPNCPGRGWNCTTATRVLQIATAGGTNSAVCTDQTCSFDQNGSSNSARCSQSSSSPTAVQSCTIRQNGAQNYAAVNQSIGQSTTSSQSGTQTAQVTQGDATPTTGVNQLQLNQATNQSIKTTSSQQDQVAGQSAIISQTAAGPGANYAGLTQSQLQKEYARSTLQNQDLTTTIADCDTDNAPSDPNVCAYESQVAENGTNENHLRQSINEDENSSGPAQQFQGNIQGNGGLDGRVHQEIVAGGTGHSLNDANQSKSQTETVPKGSASSQSQYDPSSCCGFASQLGGTGNTDSINQSSSLSASGPSPFQETDLIGTTHHDPNDGSCAISQKSSINIDSTNNSVSYPTCPEFLRVETFCTSSAEGRPCTFSGPDTSNPFPPDSSVDKGVRVHDSNAAFLHTLEFEQPSGTEVDYQLVYSNAGTGPAHGVVVTDPLAPGAAFVSGSCTPAASCSYNPDNRTITWTLGTVDPDSSVTLGFSAIASGDNCTAVVNTATVDTNEESPTDSNQATVPLLCLR